MEKNEMKEMLLDFKTDLAKELKNELVPELKTDLATELKKEFAKRDKILVELKKGQDELFKGQEQITNEVGKIGNEVNKINNEVDKIWKELDKLSLSVARMEADHGEKLGILLDVVTGHTDKFKSVDNRIKKCENRLDNHDNKFYVLKSAVQSY